MYFGGVLGVEISKKYIGALILTKFSIIKNSIFLIQFFVIFQLLSDISTSGSITVKRALKKLVRGLIFISFGWEARTAKTTS